MDPGPFCTIKTGPQGQKVLKVVINLRVKHDLQFSQVVCCVSVQKLTNHSAECLLSWTVLLPTALNGKAMIK